MNYYQARQQKDNLRWYFTCKNDGKMWPVGYCAGPCDDDPEHASKYHEDGHPSPEAAAECYKLYLLDHDLHFNDGEGSKLMRVCEHPDCDEFTAGTATVRHHRWFLCDEHRTREVVDTLFEPPVHVFSSY